MVLELHKKRKGVKKIEGLVLWRKRGDAIGAVYGGG